MSMEKQIKTADSLKKGDRLYSYREGGFMITNVECAIPDFHVTNVIEVNGHIPFRQYASHCLDSHYYTSFDQLKEVVLQKLDQEKSRVLKTTQQDVDDAPF